MRQLLLRVPDELHERLARRAAAEGVSINALANGALEMSVTGGATTGRDVVRARAATRGLLRLVPEVTAPRPAAIAKAYAALAKLTITADDLIDEQRGER